MKLKPVIQCIMALVLCASLTYLPMFYVLAQPQPGCVLYGYVTIGGKQAPDGLLVTALVAGTQLNWSTPTVNGTYGWQAKGSNLFVIPSEDQTTGTSGATNGEFIEFLVNGTRADQNAIFESSAAEEVDLSIKGSVVPTLLQSALSLSLDCSAIYSAYDVKISGELSDLNGRGISAASLLASYSPNEGSSWNEIASFNTTTSGSYITGWYPNATSSLTQSNSDVVSYYQVKVGWSGDDTFEGIATSVDLGTISNEEKYVSSVISNSTISNLSYNYSSKILRFTLLGPSGTAGCANITIANDLIPNTVGARVFLDGNSVNYAISPSGDLVVSNFIYQNNSHNIEVDFASRNGPTWQMPIVGGILLGIVAALVIALYFVSRHIHFKRAK